MSFSLGTIIPPGVQNDVLGEIELSIQGLFRPMSVTENFDFIWARAHWWGAHADNHQLHVQQLQKTQSSARKSIIFFPVVTSLGGLSRYMRDMECLRISLFSSSGKAAENYMATAIIPFSNFASRLQQLSRRDCRNSDPDPISIQFECPIHNSPLAGSVLAVSICLRLGHHSIMRANSSKEHLAKQHTVSDGTPTVQSKSEVPKPPLRHELPISSAYSSEFEETSTYNTTQMLGTWSKYTHHYNGTAHCPEEPIIVRGTHMAAAHAKVQDGIKSDIVAPIESSWRTSSRKFTTEPNFTYAECTSVSLSIPTTSVDGCNQFDNLSPAHLSPVRIATSCGHSVQNSANLSCSEHPTASSGHSNMERDSSSESATLGTDQPNNDTFNTSLLWGRSLTSRIEMLQSAWNCRPKNSHAILASNDLWHQQVPIQHDLSSLSKSNILQGGNTHSSNEGNIRNIRSAHLAFGRFGEGGGAGIIGEHVKASSDAIHNHSLQIEAEDVGFDIAVSSLGVPSDSAPLFSTDYPENISFSTQDTKPIELSREISSGVMEMLVSANEWWRTVEPLLQTGAMMQGFQPMAKWALSLKLLEKVIEGIEITVDCVDLDPRPFILATHKSFHQTVKKNPKFTQRLYEVLPVAQGKGLHSKRSTTNDPKSILALPQNYQDTLVKWLLHSSVTLSACLPALYTSHTLSDSRTVFRKTNTVLRSPLIARSSRKDKTIHEVSQTHFPAKRTGTAPKLPLARSGYLRFIPDSSSYRSHGKMYADEKGTGNQPSHHLSTINDWLCGTLKLDIGLNLDNSQTVVSPDLIAGSVLIPLGPRLIEIAQRLILPGSSATASTISLKQVEIHQQIEYKQHENPILIGFANASVRLLLCENWKGIWSQYVCKTATAYECPEKIAISRLAQPIRNQNAAIYSDVYFNDNNARTFLQRFWRNIPSLRGAARAIQAISSCSFRITDCSGSRQVFSYPSNEKITSIACIGLSVRGLWDINMRDALPQSNFSSPAEAAGNLVAQIKLNGPYPFDGCTISSAEDVLSSLRCARIPYTFVRKKMGRSSPNSKATSCSLAQKIIPLERARFSFEQCGSCEILLQFPRWWLEYAFSTGQAAKAPSIVLELKYQSYSDQQSDDYIFGTVELSLAMFADICTSPIVYGDDGLSVVPEWSNIPLAVHQPDSERPNGWLLCEGYFGLNTSLTAGSTDLAWLGSRAAVRKIQSFLVGISRRKAVQFPSPKPQTETKYRIDKPPMVMESFSAANVTPPSQSKVRPTYGLMLRHQFHIVPRGLCLLSDVHRGLGCDLCYAFPPSSLDVQDVSTPQFCSTVLKPKFERDQNPNYEHESMHRLFYSSTQEAHNTSAVHTLVVNFSCNGAISHKDVQKSFDLVQNAFKSRPKGQPTMPLVALTKTRSEESDYAVIGTYQVSLDEVIQLVSIARNECKQASLLVAGCFASEKASKMVQLFSGHCELNSMSTHASTAGPTLLLSYRVTAIVVPSTESSNNYEPLFDEVSPTGDCKLTGGDVNIPSQNNRESNTHMCKSPPKDGLQLSDELTYTVPSIVPSYEPATTVVHSPDDLCYTSWLTTASSCSSSHSICVEDERQHHGGECHLEMKSSSGPITDNRRSYDPAKTLNISVRTRSTTNESTKSSASPACTAKTTFNEADIILTESVSRKDRKSNRAAECAKLEPHDTDSKVAKEIPCDLALSNSLLGISISQHMTCILLLDDFSMKNHNLDKTDVVFISFDVFVEFMDSSDRHLCWKTGAVPVWGHQNNGRTVQLHFCRAIRLSQLCRRLCLTGSPRLRHLTICPKVNLRNNETSSYRLSESVVQLEISNEEKSAYITPMDKSYMLSMRYRLLLGQCETDCSQLKMSRDLEVNSSGSSIQLLDSDTLSTLSDQSKASKQCENIAGGGLVTDDSRFDFQVS